jgi:hypothetical protein
VTWTSRAIAAYGALQKYLYLGDRGHDLYLEAYPWRKGDNPYSYIWTLREATAATIDTASMSFNGFTIPDPYPSQVSLRFKALQLYWNPTRTPPAFDSYPPAPIGHSGWPYYDDNAIVGLEYIRQYLVTHDPSLLDNAERVFTFETSGWDTAPTRPCPGGMHWVQALGNTVRGATNVTAAASELATHLYEVTRSTAYLTWSERAYRWTRTCMRSAQGLYWNDIDFHGRINKSLFIYNSGLMIGAGACLYRATHQRSYLINAESDATAATRYWAASDVYFHQIAVFNAYFFANLLLLSSEQGGRRYRPIIERYAQHIWSSYRDPVTGLFRFPPPGSPQPAQFDSRPPNRPSTLEQAAAVQIFALLAWPTTDYWRAA